MKVGGNVDVAISLTDSDGMNLNGVVGVAVTASPPTNLSRVELYIDDVLVRSNAASPLTYDWNTVTATNGSHILRGEAVYNKRRSKTQIAVTVNNSAPPPPPPPSGWPASYFTGPLGSENILPAVSTGSLLNLWSGGVGNNADSRALVQSRIADSGRTPDCVATKLTGADLANGDSYSLGGAGGRGEIWIHSLGAVPIVSWDWNVTPASVAAGTQDASLSTVATRLAGAGYRIILRLWREQNIQNATAFFTGDINDTQPQLDQIAADWKAGWQYVVNYFQTNGATNVGFCWCPSEKANRNNVSGQSGRNQLLATYPGDAYVDWIGADGYNRAGTSWSTPTHNGWASFNEVFNYHTLGYVNPALVDEYTSKPFYVWETGCKYDPSSPSRKATWFKDIDDVAKDSMSRLQGVQFFDEWVSAESNDWRVDRDQVSGTGLPQGNFDQTTYDGWLDLAGRARWNVGVAGGAT